MIENPNPNNFYSIDEMNGREMLIPKAKEDVLKKLGDLKTKIEKEEPFPEKNQNLDELVEIGDIIDQALNKWYY